MGTEPARPPVLAEPDDSRVSPEVGGGPRASTAEPGPTPATVGLSLLEAEEALRDPELLRQWESSLSLVHPLNRMFASPDWFFHRWRAYRRGNRVAILRDGEKRVVGVCPLDFYPATLHYTVRKWNLRTSAFPSAVLMGGELMAAPDPALFRALLDGLFEEMKGCGCLTIEATPLEGMTWQFLQGPGRRGRNYYTYDPTGERRTWYYIELGRDFEAYLKSLPSKARTNIRNSARKFRKTSPGAIECQRVRTEDQVGHFYEAACQIAERSWRHREFGRESGHPMLVPDSLTDLARSQLLRAYLLTCGGDPIAYVVGYQFQGVYQYAETAYVEELGSLGPGTFLLHSILEDLHEYDAPGFLNFGVGAANYKKRFANRSAIDGGILLFRRTPVNRLRSISHGAFRSGLLLAKRLLKGRRSPSPPPDSEIPGTPGDRGEESGALAST